MNKNIIVSIVLGIVTQVGLADELKDQKFGSMMNFGLHALSTQVLDGKNLVIIGAGSFPDGVISDTDDQMQELLKFLTSDEGETEEGMLGLAIEFEIDDCKIKVEGNAEIFNCTKSTSVNLRAVNTDYRGKVLKVYNKKLLVKDNNYLAVSLLAIQTTSVGHSYTHYQIVVRLSFDLNGSEKYIYLDKANLSRLK